MNNTLLVKKMDTKYSSRQIITLTALRVVIGWHFLYEGMFKYIGGVWSSRSFLLNSTGPLASLFKMWAQSDKAIHYIDMLNIWGLILIGLCLFLGFFERPAKLLGITLLSLYYFTYPPFSSAAAGLYADGNYWIVDRNLIEIASLLVLASFPTGYRTGLDRFMANYPVRSFFNKITGKPLKNK